jgi:hypothetical protein
MTNQAKMAAKFSVSAVREKMHNIWNSSQAITSFLYAAQWTVALAGILALTLTIRKNYLTSVAQSAANERIATANKLAEVAHADASKADARAAEAHARAAEANQGAQQAIRGQKQLEVDAASARLAQ